MRRCAATCPMYDYDRRMCMQCGRYIRFLNECPSIKYDRVLKNEVDKKTGVNYDKRKMVLG